MIPFHGLRRESGAHFHDWMAALEPPIMKGQLLQGEEVKQLERRLAELTDRQFACAVGSCTDALFFALKAAGVQPGDEVLVPDFTFVASASCILRLGATPVFVDVREEDYCMDLSHAAVLITEKTRAMILVDLFGFLPEPGEYEWFSKNHDLILIEDAAQSLGARRGVRPAGSVGTASCLSFDPTKPISAPSNGGAVVTDSFSIAEQVRRLRYHGKVNGSFRELGYNSQLSSISASLLSRKLEFLTEWQEARWRVAEFYYSQLRGGHINLPWLLPGHAFSKFVIGLPHRDVLREALTAAQVATKIHYECPLHQQPLFRDHHAVSPVTTWLCHQILSLPIHPYLKDEELERIVGTVREFSG